MNFTELEVIRSLFDGVLSGERTNAEALHLTANENVLSHTARGFLNSSLSFRYYSDLYEQGRDLRHEKYYLFSGCMFRGLPDVYALEQYATREANRMFSASFTNFLPLSGIHAVLSVFLALTRLGDKVLIFTSDTLGHHATTNILRSIGRDVLYFPWSDEEMDIDFVRLGELIDSQKPDLIFFDLGAVFYPLPIAKIRAMSEPGTLMIYDGSHVLGLIAGGKFQDPISEGCDILIGNTHKTFPGPQKGMMMFKDADLGRRVSREMLSSVVSNQHTHHSIALFVTILEMAHFGQAYASQIVRNSLFLAQSLGLEGFRVLTKSGAQPQTHMLGLTAPFEDGNHLACAALQDASIVTNSKNMMGIPAIRLGVQEITRRGMKENEMKVIAEMFRKIIIEKNGEMTEQVLEFNRSFLHIEYSFDDLLGYAGG